MRPFDTEVLALEKVLCTFLALLVDRIVQRKISRELVLHQIARIQVHRPGTEGVVVSCHSKVKVVSEDEIHSGIPEIEASGILLAERRHQKTGRPGRLLRDETERIKNTQGDIQYIVAQGIASQKSAFDIAKDLEKYVDPSAKKDWAWSKVYPGTKKVVDYNAQRLARTMVSHAYF